MKLNEKYSVLASEESIKKTINTLKMNNFNVAVVENKVEARRRVLEMIPEKTEVFTMSSQTLEVIGIDKDINQS